MVALDRSDRLSSFRPRRRPDGELPDLARGESHGKTDRRLLLPGQLTVSARPGAPVAALMNELAARTGIDPTAFFLLFGGKVLRSESTLADYNLANGSQLLMSQRLMGGAGQPVKRPRIEVAEIDWTRLAEEEDEWRADREEQYCEGWGDGCGGEHAHQDSDENMDDVEYSYSSSEEDEEARRTNGGCQKKPRTQKQIKAELRARNS